MAVSPFAQSCDQHRNYPVNLIEPGPTYPSVLREYKNRFEARIGGQLQKDSLRTTFVFVGASSSRDPLYISYDMTRWVLSFFQVLPMFQEFLFAFGGNLSSTDLHFSGFREDTRIEAGFQRGEVTELGRSGQDFQLCYNLKTFEQKPGSLWPWSSRQSVIFHSFDVKKGHASWIAVKANNVIRDRLKEVSNTRLGNDPDAFRSIPKMFANTMACHAVIVEWCAEDWRWYLNYIEEHLTPLRRRAVVDKVARFVPQSPQMDPQPTGIPMGNLASRPTLRDLTLGRRSTTRSQVAANAGLQHPAQPLPAGVAVHVSEQPREPPNVPPEFDPKLQGEITEEDRKMKYQIQELQDAQALEIRVNEASLVLNSNIHVLSQIEKFFQELPKSADLPEEVKKGMPAEIARFLKRLRSVRSDLRMHLQRVQTMVSLISECKGLLYGIVEYQAMQANHKFADEAQRSAQRMETLTKQMQDMTIKTTLETVLMRIITVVTVFFLPATFVSTFMSADIISFVPSDSSITSGSMSMGGLKLFLCLSFSLMAATFVGGFTLWWGASSTPVL
ncbi:hypothetical protein LTR10_023779 [Elasticomyces elasticus]|uniref:CorA-like transporter domain-containing protein n=1 Tax=Exophiala sideris TaxID=1016849 RepID=A0ABR0JJI4_9EURO|nr:hypothetical protein LTR10_023779 [Elasticomyces elasticus]KAK5034201.1 hypothetical protein LTS07_003121 [Exophiala sideris]KAK5042497.1 hypothetical protein LTR13_001344 [Exophiala sideris]KAK5065579.1 hypothetical protein LTR69_003128 [Exophiala sideris]KAK5185963.1 hypothetical protein LTR44_002012 [Eurotiomycetes sp. CCFEE 6388]